jgi:hypothetical protein
MTEWKSLIKNYVGAKSKIFYLKIIFLKFIQSFEI